MQQKMICVPIFQKKTIREAEKTLTKVQEWPKTSECRANFFPISFVELLSEKVIILQFRSSGISNKRNR
jgi:hypothetical protein